MNFLLFIVPATCFIFYHLSIYIYNIYFHPLRSIPGPKLWAASRIPKTYYKLRGVLPFALKDLHDKYGDAVRVSPNAVDYRSSTAWKDIYGFVKIGKEQNFPKDMTERRTPKNVAKIDIVNCNEEDHRRFRRLQSHAFSMKALAAQEPLIQSHARDFISAIRKVSSSSPTGVVPLLQWFNLSTFDLIGDLAFGESFHGVTTGVIDPWISHIFDILETLTWDIESRVYPILKPWVYFMAKDKLNAMKSHQKLAVEKAERRMNTKTDRPDFTSYIMKYNETEKGMSAAEIKSNASILMLGGSETTATLLTGLTYHLLQTPPALQKLTHEIRSNFKHDEDIVLQRVAEMKYLNACLEEGLRMYPPIPSTLPRFIPKGGATVCGKFLPEGTSVGVNQYSANYSAANFSDPKTFHPERWLGDSRFANDDLKARQPFSYGPANCIGMNLAYAEMGLLLAKLVWNFDLEDGEGDVKIVGKQGRGGSGRGKGNWLKRNRIYMLWLKPELWVRLKERKDARVE